MDVLRNPIVVISQRIDKKHFHIMNFKYVQFCQLCLNKAKKENYPISIPM